MKNFLTTLSAAIDFKSRTARRACCSAASKAAGTFDELVAQGGIFANLVKRQTA